jgi:hypothetical protein
MKDTEKQTLLKNFLEEHFDFDELKKVGLFDKTIKRKDYEKQAERICEYFGFETVYQYGFETIQAHITYENRKDEPFVETFKAWHQK